MQSQPLSSSSQKTDIVTSQDWILKIMEKLGLETGMGQCHGAICVWAHEVIAQREKEMKKMVHQIRETPADELVEKIKSAKARKLSLLRTLNSSAFKNLTFNLMVNKIANEQNAIEFNMSSEACLQRHIEANTDEETQFFFDIDPFLQAIKICQDGYKLPEFFPAGEVPFCQSVEALSAVLSKKLTGIAILEAFSGAYTKEELLKYLISFRNWMLKQPVYYPMPVYLRSSNHAIGFTYDCSKNKWRVFDLNSPLSLDEEDELIQNEVDVMKYIFYAFSPTDDVDSVANSVLALATLLLVAKEHLTAMSKMRVWHQALKLMLPMTEERVVRQDVNGVTWLYMAVLRGFVEETKLLLEFKQNQAIINQENYNKLTFLQLAVCHKHDRRLINLLLSHGANLRSYEKKMQYLMSHYPQQEDDALGKVFTTYNELMRIQTEINNLDGSKRPGIVKKLKRNYDKTWQHFLDHPLENEHLNKLNKSLREFVAPSEAKFKNVTQRRTPNKRKGVLVSPSVRNKSLKNVTTRRKLKTEATSPLLAEKENQQLENADKSSSLALGGFTFFANKISPIKAKIPLPDEESAFCLLGDYQK